MHSNDENHLTLKIGTRLQSKIRWTNLVRHVSFPECPTLLYNSLMSIPISYRTSKLILVAESLSKPFSNHLKSPPFRIPANFRS